MVVEQTGSCYIEDNCLHEEKSQTLLYGSLISASLILLAAYLIFFDKTHKMMEHTYSKISDIEKANDNTTFNAFLSGFTDKEKKVIKAIKEQEGILQSTLRFRTNMSKTSLSLLLKNLEERNIISRKPYNKTNKIYLQIRY